MKTHPADRELAAAVRAASVAELCAALRNRAGLKDVVYELRRAAFERRVADARKAWAAWGANRTEANALRAERLSQLEDRAWKALERAAQHASEQVTRTQPLNMTRKRALQLQRAAEGLCVVHVPPARGKGSK